MSRPEADGERNFFAGIAFNVFVLSCYRLWLLRNNDQQPEMVLIAEDVVA